MAPIRAVDKGIKKLYHYEKFCPQYLADTLAKQRVHFSNPSNFNDPWDCYPCFDTTQSDNAEYRARCIEVLRQFPLPHFSNYDRHVFEGRLRADRNFFIARLHEFRDPLHHSLGDTFRIYCLTPKADMPLMWSHYSSHHTGICLEFDTSEPDFGNAFKVEYQKTLTAIDITTNMGEAYFNTLTTKSPDWCYESEYRLLARDQSAAKGYPTTTNNDFFQLSPGALTGIIVGCRSDVEAIRALVKRHAPDLPLKRAIQSTDSYSLFIE